jgi:hypothetical protein
LRAAIEPSSGGPSPHRLSGIWFVNTLLTPAWRHPPPHVSHELRIDAVRSITHRNFSVADFWEWTSPNVSCARPTLAAKSLRRWRKSKARDADKLATGVKGLSPQIAFFRSYP